MKKPWVAALANLILPGFGYILIGKRKIFGALILLMIVIGQIHLLIDPLPDVYVWGSTTTSVILGAIAIILFPIAFAYDAYQLASE